MRSRAKIACILYHDRDLNEMCDRVGQQRHRHSLACDCLHQLNDVRNTLADICEHEQCDGYAFSVVLYVLTLCVMVC